MRFSVRSRLFPFVASLLLSGPFVTAAGADDKPLVFVSIPPQEFVVEKLVGDRVLVEVLLPPGASPATYEPTPRQMARLDRATIYLQIGSPFEGPLLEKLTDLMPDLEVVDCRKGVELVPIEGHTHGHGEDFLDPHIWMDPTRMKTIAATTAASLLTLLPDAGDEINQRLRDFVLELDALDQKISGKLAPFSGREVLVFHPAYGYFTRRYGLQQVAIEEDGKAPSARRLATIVESVSEGSITAIFVQPQFSKAAAQRVADALGCQVVELDPLEENYSANLVVMADRIAAALGESR